MASDFLSGASPMNQEPEPLPATPPGMCYEVGPSPTIPDAWNVDAINFAGDGEFYTAIFAGRLGRERAEEYAAWKNAQRIGPQ